MHNHLPSLSRALALVGLVAVGAVAAAFQAPVQQGTENVAPKFEDASVDAQTRLSESLAELARLREEIVAERVPLGQSLSGLEIELSTARQEFQRVSRLLDTRTLDLSNLRSELKARQDEAGYLSNLLGEYIRNFEPRLHIAEVQRYRGRIEAAKLAPENSNLSSRQVFDLQAGLLTVSLDRIEEALGGTRFDGAAVDAEGLVNQGTFVLIGPAAIFRSSEGEVVGTAEQRLSTEPIIVPFSSEEDATLAASLVRSGAGSLPFDATLGNAHKMEATNETFAEHFKKGGPVMYPIFVMGGAALLVAVLKWLGLTLLRRPAPKSINALLDAVGRQDGASAQKIGSSMSERGPVGRMLWIGVQHMSEPRELVEEAMYETVLTAKHRLNSYLPFLAICAASAPLLGLLGTVTGIINTFKLITVFGSGDVKSLSGGISEALITTEWGLIVAIPSLLLHAFLSRKARSIVAQMESTAVAFVNRIVKSSSNDDISISAPRVGHTEAAADPELVRAQVTKILGELLGPLNEPTGPAGRGRVTQHS
jgi:biopolymer transport protein ExbB